MDPVLLFKQGMLLVVVLSAPPLIVAVVVGVLTSLVQALMQDRTRHCRSASSWSRWASHWP